MERSILLMIVGFMICNACQKDNSSDSMQLYDLNEYLSYIQSEWETKSNILKIYQSGDAEIESGKIDGKVLPETFVLFDKYNINKPDYADKYQWEQMPGKDIYKAIHRNPKVRRLVVYNRSGTPKPDSVHIDYLHKSIIGQSEHIILIRNTEIELKRIEKYLFSDSLISKLTLRAID